MESTGQLHSMDWLTFVSTMTSALAWPLVVAAVACFYRTEIRMLVASMRRLKVGPMEAEMFEMKAREVRDLAIALPQRDEEVPEHGEVPETLAVTPTAPATTKDAESDRSKIDDDLLELVEDARRWGTHRLALLSAWSTVEDSLRSFAEQHSKDPHASVVTMLLELQRSRLITKAEYELLRGLYDLRTSAAVASVGLSDETLLDYVSAASAILRKTGLSNKPGRSAALRSVSLGVKISE